MRGAGIFDKAEMPEKPESLATITNDAWELLYVLEKSDLYNCQQVMAATDSQKVDVAVDKDASVSSQVQDQKQIELKDSSSAKKSD